MRSTAKKGFTLIELLIVVVIIGILAAIAIPKFSTTKAKAQKSAAVADLRNLATAQESFFADNNRYFSNADISTAVPTPAGKVAYVWSQGNTGGTITGTASGWSATVTNGAGKTCAVYSNVAAVAPATVDGVPACAP